MKRLIAVLFVAACGPSPSSGNPAQLWTALNGVETKLQLVPVEPDPF